VSSCDCDIILYDLSDFWCWGGRKYLFALKIVSPSPSSQNGSPTPITAKVTIVDGATDEPLPHLNAFLPNLPYILATHNTVAEIVDEVIKLIAQIKVIIVEDRWRSTLEEARMTDAIEVTSYCDHILLHLQRYQCSITCHVEMRTGRYLWSSQTLQALPGISVSHCESIC